jgi:hypothetical protein
MEPASVRAIDPWPPGTPALPIRQRCRYVTELSKRRAWPPVFCKRPLFLNLYLNTSGSFTAGTSFVPCFLNSTEQGASFPISGKYLNRPAFASLINAIMSWENSSTCVCSSGISAVPTVCQAKSNFMKSWIRRVQNPRVFTTCSIVNYLRYRINGPQGDGNG